MSNWKPKYGGESSFKKKNHFKLGDGSLVARILPQPKGSNADYSGTWSVYHSVQFGYKNTEGKFRPFESPLVKNNKTKMIEVADPALDRLNDLKAKLEKARKEGNAAMVARLNALVGQRGVYNVDNNHHFNVMLLDGTIGELKIRHKAYVELKNEIARLRSEGADPLSFEDGRYFVFTRTGMGNETNFKVSVYKEKIDVPGVGKVERDVVSKVGADVLVRLETEGADLNKLFSKPTAEEVQQIVDESDLLTGKSPAANRIFDDRWKATRGAAQNDDGPDDDTPTVTTAAPATAPATPVQTTTQAQAAPLASTAATPAPVTPKIQAEEVDEMSDDDFFKMLEVDQSA